MHLESWELEQLLLFEVWCQGDFDVTILKLEGGHFADDGGGLERQVGCYEASS